MARDVTIPLLPLDLATPDASVSDGVLRACENLVPRPATAAYEKGRGVYLQPAASADELANVTGTVRAVGWQVRQRRGALDTEGGSLERLVVVTTENVQIVDPGDSYSATTVYTFASASSVRRAQFAQVGDSLFIATSTAGKSITKDASGNAKGEPEALLALVDDACLEYKVPVPDPYELSLDRGLFVWFGDGRGPGLTRGLYAFRFAWRMKDGTVGAAGAPRIVDTRGKRGSAENTLKNAVAIGDTSFVVTGEEGTHALYAEGARNIDQDDWDATEVFVEDELVTIASATYDSGADETTYTLVDGQAFSEAHDAGSDFEYVFPDKVTVTVDAALDLPSADHAEIFEGVAVLCAGPLDNETQAFDAPYFEVGVVDGATTGATFTFQDAKENIASYPAYDEDALTAHDVTAAACSAYNARLLLGDTCYDFLVPQENYAIGSGTAASIRFGVEIKTQGGTYERISEAVTATDGDIGLVDYLFAYPDRRATTFRIYLDTGGGSYEVAYETKLSRGEFTNLAYVLLPGGITLSATGEAMPDVEDTNAEQDCDPNRVLVAETFRPFDLRAGAAYYVGEADDHRVLGFAVNGRAVSSGQYGEHPLFVLCSEAIWAFTVTEGVFTSLVPVTTERGMVGRYAFCNANGRTFFAAHDGIWALPFEDAAPLSAPLHAPDDDDASGFLAGLTADTALAYYADAGQGRREVWVTAGTGASRTTYALSLAAGSQKSRRWWFTLGRARDHYARREGALYGIASSGGTGSIYDEGGGSEDVAVRFTTAPLHFGDRGRMKRLKRLGLRTSSAEALTVTLTAPATTSTPAVTILAGATDPSYYDRPLNIRRGNVRAAVLDVEGTVGPLTRFEGADFELYTRAAGRSRPRIFS